MLYPVSKLPGASSHIFLRTVFKGLLAVGTAEVVGFPAIFRFSRFPHLDIHPADRVNGLLLLRSRNLRFDRDEISHQSHDQTHSYHSEEDEYAELQSQETVCDQKGAYGGGGSCHQESQDWS